MAMDEGREGKTGIGGRAKHCEEPVGGGGLWRLERLGRRYAWVFSRRPTERVNERTDDELLTSNTRKEHTRTHSVAPDT